MTFGGCLSCTGDCCRRYLVPLTLTDVRQIVAATALHPREFVRLAATSFPRPGFRLRTDGPEHQLVLDRRDDGACQFLLDLPGGQARCGAYGHRPFACRTFPMTPNSLCEIGQWRPDPADLARQQTAWDAHDLVVAQWNRSLAEERSEADLAEFLLTAD